MTEKLEQLKERLGEVQDIGHAASVLSWDQQVNMPPAGNEARGRQLATLSKIAQEKFITDEVGRLIDDLQHELDGADTDESALVRVAGRDLAMEPFHVVTRSNESRGKIIEEQLIGRRVGETKVIGRIDDP